MSQSALIQAVALSANVVATVALSEYHVR